MNNTPNNGIPQFTPPAQNGAPQFTPPTQNGVPQFTPPVQNGVPQFTPPVQNGAPQFTPPAQNGAPVFTPPAPTFAPPRFNGPACSYHTDEPAVANCARCGRPICQDCVDNYGVTLEEYEGRPMCYDCYRALVADNVAQLKKNKGKIMFQFILSIIGMTIGFIYGASSAAGSGFWGVLFSGFIFACIGGVFLTAIKMFCSMFIETLEAALDAGIIAGILIGIIQSIVLIGKCIWLTISNTIYYIKYLKETSGFIESDSAALARMADYMEYSLIRNRNRGVDIATLLNQQSELADNSYARMVRENGEAGAEAALRECVATINENGEIIRSFKAA